MTHGGPAARYFTEKGCALIVYVEKHLQLRLKMIYVMCCCSADVRVLKIILCLKNDKNIFQRVSYENIHLVKNANEQKKSAKNTKIQH